MRLDETQEMLQFVEAMTQRTFPAGAAAAWYTLLGSVEFADAMQAVREWFDQPEPPAKALHPGYIKRRAHELALRRKPREIESRSPAVPPNAEYLRARAALVARWDMDRAVA